MTQSFSIPVKLPGLNEVISANRTSKYAGAKLKKDAEEQIAWRIKAAGLKPMDGPVRIHYAWYEPDKRRDWDNVASAKKFIQDALVQAGILPGDGQKYVIGFTDAFAIVRGSGGCRVTIEEVRKESA